MSDLPQISKAEFEVIKIIWKHVPMGILKEYMKKGFALDDDRLKRLGGGNYFDELPARIRDTSSSEKVFWRKVLEIYATSIDYDPHTGSSLLFNEKPRGLHHIVGQTSF